MLVGMTSDVLTTIKVPRSLRQRIADRAREQHLTAAEVLTRLLDDADRAARFAAVRAAYDAGIDDEYAADLADWETTSADGLGP